MNIRSNKITVSIICIILSGLFFYISNGFHNQWIFLWVAPILPLLYSYNYDLKHTFFVAFLSFFIGSLNLIPYMGTGLPPQIILVAMIVPSFIFSLIIMVNVTLMRRIHHWIAIFIFPSLWTSYEFIISLFMPSGPLNSLAFSQIQFLSFSQIASVTGIWGITFVMLLFGSGISYALHFKQSARYRVFAATLPVIILTICMLYGHIRLNSHHDSSESIKVGLASINASIQVPGQAGIELTKRYIKLIDNLAIQGASVVVIPERVIGMDSTSQVEILALLQQAARRDKVTIIAGVARLGQVSYNSAIIIGPDGHINGIYNKHHLVPVLESSFTPGNELFVVRKIPSWGVAICKDMDFSKPALSYGQKHVELMFVPASDFNVDGWLHAKVAVMRGIENGFAVARAAAYGLLTISDQQGRMIAMTSDVNRDETIRIDIVSLHPTKTGYSLWGDWFGWINLLVVFLFCIGGIFHRKQGSYN